MNLECIAHSHSLKFRFIERSFDRVVVIILDLVDWYSHSPQPFGYCEHLTCPRLIIFTIEKGPHVGNADLFSDFEAKPGFFKLGIQEWFHVLLFPYPQLVGLVDFDWFHFYSSMISVVVTLHEIVKMTHIFQTILVLEELHYPALDSFYESFCIVGFHLVGCNGM